MAREALVKSRTAVKNRAKNLILPILRRHNTEQPRQIERQMIAMARPPLSQTCTRGRGLTLTGA